MVAIVHGAGRPGLCPTSDCSAEGAEPVGQDKAELGQGGLLILSQDNHASASSAESWVFPSQLVAEPSPASSHTLAWGTALRTPQVVSGVCHRPCPQLRNMWWHTGCVHWLMCPVSVTFHVFRLEYNVLDVPGAVWAAGQEPWVKKCLPQIVSSQNSDVEILTPR